VYGAWHTPQNVFTEFVLFLDVDQDDVWDYQVFNWNSGAATGSTDNDEWVIVKKDLSSNVYALGSNYAILTDYNAGYMEWWLPAYQYNLSVGIDTDFVYKLAGYDDSYFTDSNVDETDKHYFDFARTPFYWAFSNIPGPSIPNARLSFRVEDPSGYIDSKPQGLMLVDYRGVPGVGQAYAHTFSIDKPYILWTPLIQR
jgi:hypothetical protein